MWKRAVWAVLALMFVAFAATLPGCEDSPTTAPNDAEIALIISPASIRIDPSLNQATGTAQLQALVFTSGGNPLEGVSVRFATQGGTLASGSEPVRTDSTGAARDTLTVAAADEGEFEVTASSSLVFDAQVVTVVVGQLPTAALGITPPNEQQIDKTVTFDGSLSIDPDSAITCYQWTIDSDVDSEDRIIQGPAASGFTRTFPDEQVMTVFLRVSDRPDTGAQCAELNCRVGECQGALGESFFSPLLDFETYEITCANSAPVAEAGPDQNAVIRLGSNSVSVDLDGTGSTDAETAIQTYRWNCGNGQNPVQIVAPGIARCVYSAPGEYIATLTVTDLGTGEFDLDTQRYKCEKSDTDDTLVTVTRQTGD